MSSATPRTGRNDPCPCGSGRKYKQCCGQVGEAAATAGPSQAEIGAIVGLIQAGRLVEAERQAEALVAREPAAGIAWKALGVARARQGRDAIEAFGRASALLPGDAESHHNLACELRERGRPGDAVAALRRAAAAAPAKADYLVDLGDALREAGDPSAAVDAYRGALRLDRRDAQALNNLGNALMELRKPDDAIACYEEALGLRPGEMLILCNLSNALRQARRAEEALVVAERAVARDPRSGMAHDHAGLALHALGRNALAAERFRAAMALSPREASIPTHLAQVLREEGCRAEALELCRRAVAIDARYADGHCNLGNVLFDLRLLDEAKASYDEALRLQPRHAAALTGVALVERQQRRPTQAIAACEAAIAADPGCVEALSLLGELRADAGDFSAAETLFRRALTVNPRFAFAYSNIAAHRRMTPGDDEWRRGAEALLEGPLPLDQRVSLHFALGKFLDDTGAYPAAFEHFRAGNDLARGVAPAYAPERFRARVDRIIRTCGPALAEACRPVASDSEVPVFIVGMPRSGTSLAEQILASHGEVHGAGEIAFWDAAFDAAGEGGEEVPLDPAALAGVGTRYLERVTGLAPGSARIVDKMPANFLYAGLIHAVFPRARIIHMRRNPVDTCLSIYFQNFFSLGQYTNDLDALVHYYGQYERISAYWRDTLPPHAYLEVPYEALTADQEGWTRRLVAFLGLPWDPRCLEFHATDRTVITASKWQVRQKMNTGSAGRWRHYRAHLGPLAGLLPAGAD